jgi:hypothetical protein
LSCCRPGSSKPSALAADDEHNARLRDTLRVFLQENGSYKTTSHLTPFGSATGSLVNVGTLEAEGVDAGTTGEAYLRLRLCRGAAGKRVADQAHRRAVSRAHGSRPGRLIHLTRHLPGYGMLLAYIWHQHRTPKDAAA